MLISDKVGIKPKLEDHCVFLKETIHQEHGTIENAYTQNVWYTKFHKTNSMGHKWTRCNNSNDFNTLLSSIYPDKLKKK